jgi:hypothetical protein
LSPDAKRHEISIDLNGKTWLGYYINVRDKSPGIQVYSYDFGNKYAALHASPAETLARIVLSELVGVGVRLTK